MQLEKPKLFPRKKEFLWVMAILMVVISLRLYFQYDSYTNFISKPFYYTKATVLTAYEKSKHGKSYRVLKLKSDEGFTFYTTTHRKENFKHKRLRLQIFPNSSIGFTDYLGTFYVKSKIKHQEKITPSMKENLLQKVSLQHESKSLQDFYNAIFFATPLDKQLRESIAKLGVSHLVALSGFHLGILWAVVYGVLLLLYRPLQQAWFPYRHALFDVGMVAMAVLGFYVWFVDAPPSLLRSYAMVFVGWSVLLLGMELLSFTFLTTILLTLMALFPSLVVSLSFWFSVAGVFYIFLLLQYTKKSNKWVISFLFIPWGIFVLMLPVVHTFFGVTSYYQLFSPLLSLLFVPFYPLVILLHLLQLGDLFDDALLWLFSLPKESVEVYLPLWLMLGYVGLSIGAIWRKSLFYVVLLLASLYMFYLFIPIE
ncbi:MAG: Competence protein [uncultured Sulfurovum sp.]|uniref:Competence protein n=1 Tax=uncultured Sulfurovum sp. TaxID=269237 RepID=A0A6S6TME5_9BACT|nr:MAG: Competence protein [uncultured Sulfurovum sp.]